MDLKDTLITLSLNKAKASLEKKDYKTAQKWLDDVPQSQRPKDLQGRLYYGLAKDAASHLQWRDCEEYLVQAIRSEPAPLYQKRLALVRKRKELLEDRLWKDLFQKVDPVEREFPDSLFNVLSGVWSCGAYYSRGTRCGSKWSRFLRIAKNPSDQSEERNAVVGLASSYLCRFICEQTPLLAHLDAVVAIPANRARFAERKMSLPDELANGIEQQLGIPFIFSGLVSEAEPNLELRGLSWAERRAAVKGSMRVGELGIAARQTILIVDDVLTSGATLCEAAELLLAKGARDVYAITLAHTEG